LQKKRKGKRGKRKKKEGKKLRRRIRIWLAKTFSLHFLWGKKKRRGRKKRKKREGENQKAQKFARDPRLLSN